MCQSTINLRIDSDVKKEADALFNEMGLSMSAAINIFIRQALRERGIPFKINELPNRVREPVTDAGGAK